LGAQWIAENRERNKPFNKTISSLKKISKQYRELDSFGSEKLCRQYLARIRHEVLQLRSFALSDEQSVAVNQFFRRLRPNRKGSSYGINIFRNSDREEYTVNQLGDLLYQFLRDRDANNKFLFKTKSAYKRRTEFPNGQSVDVTFRGCDHVVKEYDCFKCDSDNLKWETPFYYNPCSCSKLEATNKRTLNVLVTPSRPTIWSEQMELAKQLFPRDSYQSMSREDFLREKAKSWSAAKQKLYNDAAESLESHPLGSDNVPGQKGKDGDINIFVKKEPNKPKPPTVGELVEGVREVKPAKKEV